MLLLFPLFRQTRRVPFFQIPLNNEIVLDNASLPILAELQRDAQPTVQQLAQTIGPSGTPCWKRIRDMESAGVVRGYAARLDREKNGRPVPPHRYCPATSNCTKIWILVSVSAGSDVNSTPARQRGPLRETFMTLA